MNIIRVDTYTNQDRLASFVDYWELRFEAQLAEITQQMTALTEIVFMGLTGPTCSGKTTAAKKLTANFEKHGKRVHIVSIDDFYHSQEYLYRLAAEKGMTEPDYDSEDTINIELLSDCVESLLAHRPTQLPYFNFQTGNCEKGKLLLIKPNDIVLFEGIQLLYPAVDKILSEASCKSIFICPNTALQFGKETFMPNEIRLMRRLVRDYHFRNTDPEFTFRIWRSVRENEEKNIFPNISKCDFFVDSTMPYGLGILKPYLKQILPTIPKKSSFRNEADRVLDRISNIRVISKDLIGEHSLYKEFV